MHAATESTRRALRTALQGLMGFATLLVAVAIPPVGDAINVLLGLFPGVEIRVTPGVIAAIGVVGTALIALATKIQNVVEGRDDIESVDELAQQVMEIAALLDAVIDAAQDAGVEVGAVLAEQGWELTPLEVQADADAAGNDRTTFPYA